MNLIDATLEKGKGSIIGKLKTIMLIEGDLQILMRKYLRSKSKELIEKSTRFSKANYESRKFFLIETMILEKRLMFDNSVSLNKYIICNLTDLQSYYNRQLANIRSIVEEAVGRDH